MKRNKGRKTIFSDEQIQFMNDLCKNQLDKYSSKDRQRLRSQIMKQTKILLCDLDFFILVMKHDKKI